MAIYLERRAETRSLAKSLPILMSGALVGDVLALACLVRDEYTLRTIRELGVRLQAVSCPAGGAAQALADAAEEIQKLQDALPGFDEVQPLASLVVELIDALQEAAESNTDVTSPIVPATFIGSLLPYLVPGHLVGLCGVDSAGKTTLATQLYGEVVDYRACDSLQAHVTKLYAKAGIKGGSKVTAGDAALRSKF